MKNMKKLTALMLALVLAFAMSATALALDGNEVYLSPAPGTEYTTITSDSSVPLEVLFSATTDYVTWYNTGFNSATDAESVSWTVKSDPAGLVSSISRSSGTEDNLITAIGTVNLIANKHGVAIIEARYNNFTLDLTICVEAPATVSAKTGVTIEVADARDGNSQYSGLYATTDAPLTVSAIADVSGHAFANAEAVAQSFPTAFGALCQMVGTSNVIVDSGYVTSITAVDYATEANITLVPYMDGNYDYFGWNYCVIRTVDGETQIVADSLNMSAAIFELQSNDYVIWAFGTADEAATYFDMMLNVG